MKKYSLILTLFCSLVSICGLRAEVHLAGIFGDNMVLQREEPVKIWGWADRKETVTVAFNGQRITAKADPNGAWSVVLQPMTAGGPYTLEVKGKNNTIKCENVLLGEVWLCSGQSNMEWPVSYSANAGEEIAAANYPGIRAFNVARSAQFGEQANLSADWKICSPETVSDFSAVAYFYARKLHQELGVPVGIINSSWGGTDIETWFSGEAYKKLPKEVKRQYDPVLIASLEKYQKEFPGELDLYSERKLNDRGMAEKWYLNDTNDQDWARMLLPREWSDTPLADVDGLVWFRYALTLPASVAGTVATIQLGGIDDEDICWVNGVEVGRMNGHANKRIYTVPAGVLKAGRNVITIRVEDVIGPGGFMGQPEDMFLRIPGAIPEKISLAASWKYRPTVINADYQRVQFTPNSLNSLLYNGMIRPLVNFKIRGVIWYQGENNVWNAYAYRTLFPKLIEDWRAQWGYEFPFYWVQLANFMQKTAEPANSAWAELREAQTMTLSLPQTGQAVITDIGDAMDIHPRNKQDVGKRLALNALHGTYGKEVIFSGPTYRSMEKKDNQILLTFDLHGSNWELRNKYGYIEGFSIAGEDQRFYWAKAELQGDKIVVWSEQVSDPVAVRFCWADNPDVNLFNQAGLPAVPFRTDQWKGVTER